MRKTNQKTNKSVVCSCCGTEFEGRLNSYGLEVYDPVTNKFRSDCPSCGKPSFAGARIEDEFDDDYYFDAIDDLDD